MKGKKKTVNLSGIPQCLKGKLQIEGSREDKGGISTGNFSFGASAFKKI